MHFEKTYAIHQFSSKVFLIEVKLANYFFEDQASYVQLVHTSLRGPPAV
jgi:hypothetical protein